MMGYLTRIMILCALAFLPASCKKQTSSTPAAAANAPVEGVASVDPLESLTLEQCQEVFAALEQVNASDPDDDQPTSSDPDDDMVAPGDLASDPDEDMVAPGDLASDPDDDMVAPGDLASDPDDDMVAPGTAGSDPADDRYAEIEEKLEVIVQFRKHKFSI